MLHKNVMGILKVVKKNIKSKLQIISGDKNSGPQNDLLLFPIWRKSLIFYQVFFFFKQKILRIFLKMVHFTYIDVRLDPYLKS